MHFNNFLLSVLYTYNYIVLKYILLITNVQDYKIPCGEQLVCHDLIKV